MLRIVELIWDDWNESHIRRHSVRPEEVEQVCHSAKSFAVRMRRGRYRLIGQAESGRYLTVILDLSSRGRFYVVTARDATVGEGRRLQQWRT